jgi:hypothetical protein
LLRHDRRRAIDAGDAGRPVAGCGSSEVANPDVDVMPAGGQRMHAHLGAPGVPSPEVSEYAREECGG